MGAIYAIRLAKKASFVHPQNSHAPGGRLLTASYLV